MQSSLSSNIDILSYGKDVEGASSANSVSFMNPLNCHWTHFFDMREKAGLFAEGIEVT